MSYEAGGMPAGGNSRFRGYPARMSERQQLALILQMTSQEMTSGSSSRSESTVPLSHARSSPVHHHKSSKSRWSNKNADLIDTSFSRQDDRLRIVNGCDAKERNEFAGSNSPDEVRQASGAESPVAAGSPAECAATAIPAAAAAVGPAAAVDHQSDSSSSSKLGGSNQEAEEDAAAYEMRRTPPTNKVDRQASAAAGQHQQASSGSSPRVTLRLNQVRATRDEKKGAAGPGTSAAAATAPSSTSSAAGQSNSAGTASSARQQTGSSAAVLSSSQMETSTNKSASGSTGASSTSASASSTTACSSGGPVSGGNVNTSGGSAGNVNSSSSSSSADGGDVYEFKSSKEATPVRGSSSSPNPSTDKDGKEAASSSSSLSSSSAGSQGQSVGSGAGGGSANAVVSGSSGVVGSSTTSSSAAASSTSNSGAVGSSSASSTTGGVGGSSAEALAASAASAMSDEPMMSTMSPQPSTGAVASSTSTKRSFESDSGQTDEQDEEGRKRKKKETESGKETGGAKGATSSRQAAGRNNPGITDKCAKSGKQVVGAMSTKGGQSNSSITTERKSPSSSLNANSPKPSNSSSSSTANNPKGNAPVSTESDGEDERSKNSDCNSAPKVPPLKIVIPQSTTSEQEQGTRNGKNTSNRSHQLPYVVASSNSNDSMDKEQSMSTVTSGTTSPLDNSSATPKGDEKKDFSGALDNESRSTHHQRVLRSSHRSGNGGNGTTGTRESSTNIPGNGNYSNSSPLPANAADRSNNSSPQQRHHSPTPESSGVSEAGKLMSTDSPSQNSPAVKSSGASDKCEKNVEIKKEVGDTSDSGIKKESGSEIPNTSSQAPVDLHPRKRKMKPSKEAQQAAATASASDTTETTSSGPEIHPHDQPITNCYQLFLNIRKQIERRRKGLFPVQPKPPQGFKDYLMNRCTYVLAGNANKEPNINPPVSLMPPMKDLYIEQEKERYSLRMQHVVEKEKLVLSVEQEILRVHGRAARALANQSLPFSVCTILKDEEVYNVITPEQEEKDRNARSRYNGRLFLSWLQDVDDKWEKIKESMLLRHHNEAESLHAVQRMDWEWKLKEVGLCEFKAKPQIEDLHVPMVHVSDDFDLLPA